MNPYGYSNHWNMSSAPNHFYQAVHPNSPYIITGEMADVTGDGIPDKIFLTGNKEMDSPYIRNISLVLIDGRTNELSMYTLPENAGYDPTLWIGPITGKQKNDVLITIQSGGSGAIVFAYVFSFINGSMKKVFDSIQFHEAQKYGVNYTNDYKVVITSSSPRKRYILDIQTKGKEYLNEIYTPDGRLKTPISGWVDPISGIYPIDYTGNGTYALLTREQIAGRYHADGLGTVENLLAWNGSRFENVRQSVAIYGENL